MERRKKELYQCGPIKYMLPPPLQAMDDIRKELHKMLQFVSHTRKVNGGHKISFQLASKLLDKEYECIRGWQLCRPCYDRAQNLDIDMSQTGHESAQSGNKLVHTTTDYSTSDIDSDEVQKQSRDTLNRCLQYVEGTPVRTRSMPEHRRMKGKNYKEVWAVSNDRLQRLWV